MKSFALQAQSARDAIYTSLGDVEPNVIAPLINSAFEGGFRWPGLSQAWRVIHRGGKVAYVSDGLTNPYEDQVSNVGCGLECYMEVDDLPKNAIYDNIILRHVIEFSHQIAGFGNITGQLAEYGVMALDLFPSEMGLTDLPEKWLNDSGNTTILLSAFPPADLKTHYSIAAGDIMLLTAKLLTGKEADFATKNEVEGRQYLVDIFIQEETFHMNSLNRKSVI